MSYPHWNPHCKCCTLAEQFLAKQNRLSFSRDQLRKTLCVLHEDRRCQHTNEKLPEAFNEVLRMWRMPQQPPHSDGSNPQSTLQQCAQASPTCSTPMPPPSAPWTMPPPSGPWTQLSGAMMPPGMPLQMLEVQRYEQVFGKCTREYPYGERCWEGLHALMETYPHKSQARHELNLGNFTGPLNFSKKGAEEPMSQGNPAGPYRYPCIVARSAQPDYPIVICIYMLFYGSRPWYAHISWVVTYA